MGYMHPLEKLIASRRANVAVVGLGYVGMPLVRALLVKGFGVTGIDTDKARIALIGSGASRVAIAKSKSAELPSGESYPGGVHPREVAPFIKKRKLSLSSDFSRVRTADIVVICTPTPLGEHQEPDLQYVRGAAKEVARYLKKGALVVLESTSYPGTTRELLPLFEPRRKAGKDFYLSFSPERIDPGNKVWRLENIPKIVGGIDERSRDLAAEFYRQFIAEVHPVSSLEVAEMAKLLENIFRLVNISLVNEMTLLADKMGVNMWEVIDAAKTKPYGFMPFYPSPGAGGHCIPLDPLYLVWKAKEYGFYPRFIELAAEVNHLMPDFGVAKIAYVLNRAQKSVRGAKVLVIGATYKKDVADIRESSAVRVIGKILHNGADVRLHDPYVGRIEIKDPYKAYSTGVYALESAPLTAELIRECDCVVIAVDHSNVDYELIGREAKVIVDLRNAMHGKKSKAKVFHL